MCVDNHQALPWRGGGQSKMGNPTRLATQGTQDEEKQNKNTT